MQFVSPLNLLLRLHPGEQQITVRAASRPPSRSRCPAHCPLSIAAPHTPFVGSSGTASRTQSFLIAALDTSQYASEIQDVASHQQRSDGAVPPSNSPPLPMTLSPRTGVEDRTCV